MRREQSGKLLWDREIMCFYTSAKRKATDGMANANQDPLDRQQYIIGKTSSTHISLSDIYNVLKADPQTDIVKAQGKPDDPNLLVALLTPERAKQLKEQYRGQLVIDVDATLYSQ